MKNVSRLVCFLLAMIAVASLLGGFCVDVVEDWVLSAEDLTYTETIQLISENEVKSVKLYSNDSDAIIHLKNDTTRYVTTIPNDEVFCDYIQQNISNESELEITVEKKVTVWKAMLYIVLSVVVLYITVPCKKKSPITLFYDFYFWFNGIIVGDLNEAEETESQDTPKTKSTQSKIDFSRVAGLKEEKEELMEVVDFLKNPEKYSKVGAKMPKGVLLSGPPGTGKTLLAKAVANEAQVSFFAASGSEFDEMYVGVGASRVRKLFERAKANMPSIIFIDEIDAVGQTRTEVDNGGTNQTLEQLLIEMDGFNAGNNIIVLGATNRPDSLDPALVRPGRFDRSIVINLPDLHDREEILRIHGKNKKFMDDVDFASIAKNTAGFSGAELENILNEAALITVRKNQEVICQENIEEALRKVTIGLQKKGRKISEKERILTAYHEAGHALICKFMPTQNNVKEISIIPRGDTGGYTLHSSTEDKTYYSKKELLERLVVLLGGRGAEQIVLDDISTGASGDLERATEIVKEMICIYGMNDKIGPISLVNTKVELIGSETISLIGKLISDTIKEAEQKALKLLNEHRTFLDMVADALLEKETISGSEFNEIFEAYQSNCATNV